MYKNPLAIAFGKALQRQRNQIGKTSGEISDEMDIGDGYYRLIESGSNNLHVNKALSLVKAFSGTVEFDAVTKLLGSLSTMEMMAKKEKDEGFEYADGLSRASAEISEFDEKMKSLFDEFTLYNLFEDLKESPETVEEKVIEVNLDRRVWEFLTAYQSFGIPPESAQSEYLSTFFDDVPSMYISVLGSIKKHLVSLPTVTAFDEIQEWEKMHLDEMKYLYAVVKNYKTVIHSKNLESYEFRYLWGDSFRKAQFVFLNTEKSASDLKNHFYDLFKRSYEERKKELPDDFDTQLKKIQFKVSNEPGSFVKDVMQDHDAAWFYAFEDGNNIGFLANGKPSEEEPDYEMLERSVNLSHDKSVEGINSFRRLWEMA